MSSRDAEVELKHSNPTRKVANGIGEQKAWVRQASRQRETTLESGSSRAVVKSSGRTKTCGWR
jgi:hypothetical protein